MSHLPPRSLSAPGTQTAHPPPLHLVHGYFCPPPRNDHIHGCLGTQAQVPQFYLQLPGCRLLHCTVLHWCLVPWGSLVPQPMLGCSALPPGAEQEAEARGKGKPEPLAAAAATAVMMGEAMAGWEYKGQRLTPCRPQDSPDLAIH